MRLAYVRDDWKASAAERPVTTATPASEGSSRDRLRSARRIGTILLVDDSRVTRMFVERILRPHCERVVMASGADEGIEVIADEREISLVISDVYMAAGDGFRLLRDLQELPDPPGALLMTGRDISEEDRRRADELGAIGFRSGSGTSCAPGRPTPVSSRVGTIPACTSTSPP